MWGDREMSVKQYKLLDVSGVSLGDLMYSMAIIVNNTVLLT